MKKHGTDKSPAKKRVMRETYSLWPEAGQMIGIGRTSTYAAANRGEIPILTIGGVKLVPKRKLHEMLGIED